jgi:general secretion pathway protein G
MRLAVIRRTKRFRAPSPSEQNARGPADRKDGFTLVELLAVIAIIGVLTAVLLGGAQQAVSAGMTARAKAELAALAVALESYRRAYGDYPRTNRPDELLQALIGRRGPTGVAVTGRAFVAMASFHTADDRDPFSNSDARIVDPWSTPYVYAYRSAVPWTNPSYVLYSCGRDAESAELIPGGFLDENATTNVDNIQAGR